MEQSFRALQTENFQLREYILNLQARLLETQSEVPQPPINLAASGAASLAAGQGPSGGSDAHRELPPPGASEPRQHEAQDQDAMSQLRTAAVRAQAASQSQHQSPYGLGGAEYPSSRARHEGVVAGADVKPSG
jgi:hypothetical protein